MSDLYLQAKTTGRLKFWTMVEYQICQAEAEAGKEPCALLQERFNYLKELRDECNNSFWLLLTLRPKDETLERLTELTNKVVAKKWLQDKCFWVFEQKGETVETMGDGMHVHILTKLEGMVHGKRKKTKKQCLDEVIATCKAFNFNIEDNCIDAKVGPKRDLPKVVNYLTGEKSSDKKHKAQEIDVLWREKNGITSLYGIQDSMKW